MRTHPVATVARLVFVLSATWTADAAAPMEALASFELRGVVRDDAETGLAGAELTLVHEASGKVRTATTNEAGRYAFAALAPGEYSLEVRLAGYATSRYAGLRYFDGTKPQFNITLRLRSVQESMTFTGEAPLVNVSQAQLGLSLEERQLADLPVPSRDYLDLVSIEGPAQTIRESFPTLSVPSPGAQNIINGADVHYATYLLDGLSNTREHDGSARTPIALPAIEEFRVVSGQYSAEHGALSGLVSATTKSGSNELGGTLYAFVRPSGWGGRDPLTSEKLRHSRQDVGFTLGGPVIVDRTWFFTGLEYRNDDEEVAVTAPIADDRFAGVFELPSEYVRFLGKVSHHLGDRHQLVATAAASNRSALEGVGGYDTFDSGFDVDDEDLSVYGSWTSEFGSLLSELRASLSRERYRASLRSPPTFGFVVTHPTEGKVGSPTSLERVEETSFDLKERISFSAGNHGVAFGFRVARTDSETEITTARDGVFTFAPGSHFLSEPVLFTRSFVPTANDPLVDRAETVVELFVQDDWMVSSRLSVNTGLRWERESSVGENDNVSPRLGIHWDPAGDGRTSVRAGYGVFYGRVFSAVDAWEHAFGEAGQRTIVLTPDDPFFPPPRPGAESRAPARTPANLFVSAPSFAPSERRSPYSQQITVGLEREIAPTFTLSLDLSHVRGSSLVIPIDLNAPAFFDYTAGTTRSATRADASRPFGVPGSAIAPGQLTELPEGYPFNGYRDLYLLTSRGANRYWGVRVNGTKRYGGGLLLQAVYQWSRSRNTGDDFRVSESLPLAPSQLVWARAATDIPHSLTVNGVWEAPFGLQLTGVLRARSGAPVDPRVDRDLDGDRKLRERPVRDGRILERNSFRAPTASSIDLSLGRRFGLSEGRSVETRLDVYNATNRLNPRQLLRTYGSGNAPLPAFLSIVQAESPRRLSLSLRVSF
jgi:hypothetical protein